jgi:crotonyl-CoA carboxylase/reductase
MGFDGVAEAHQLLHENKHLGKIAILVGAEAEDEGKTEEGPGDPGRGRSMRQHQPERGI